MHLFLRERQRVHKVSDNEGNKTWLEFINRETFFWIFFKRSVLLVITRLNDLIESELRIRTINNQDFKTYMWRSTCISLVIGRSIQCDNIFTWEIIRWIHWNEYIGCEIIKIALLSYHWDIKLIKVNREMVYWKKIKLAFVPIYIHASVNT